ncbi:uncharacterized protein B0T15DRAFT_219141 [Chaetomium strumarium]|uniref:Zn(2)-C6 fungal-type domain-containing protein n=1 Tax=Chaetomium strumarium TaxID=1170767 RepID=A0AAJ0GUL9_9PEZI|nr:hypothetical protein B0T15DRAFT_219141 [Chaetomium strumarium]
MIKHQDLACDRCHALKERCTFRSKRVPAACSRCERLGTQCTTSRQKTKGGRPRKTETASSEPRAGTEFVWFGCPPPDSSSSDDAVLALLPPTPTSNPLLPVFPGGSTRLTRRECLLLQAYLTNRRLIARFLLSPSAADGVLAHLYTTLHAAPDTLLHVLLACAKRFARDQASQAEEKKKKKKRTAPLPSEDHPHANDTCTKHTELIGACCCCCCCCCCHSHGAKAVMTLRRMESELVANGAGGLGDQQAVLALTLGLGLVTFDLLDSGRWAHEVCRFTLGLVERGYNSNNNNTRRRRGGEKKEEEEEEEEEWVWRHRTGRVPEVDAWLMPLVWMDVVNCLVLGQVPVCRLEVSTEASRGVDKYVGVCGELLAPLYDLCRLRHELRTLGSQCQGHAATARATLLRELENIEDTVVKWDPRAPEHFSLASTPDELQAIETQAKIFRAATLLVIHRLRYGFGLRDEESRQLRQAILTDIDTLCLGISPGRSRAEDNGPPLDYRLSLPFFIAAIEVQDPGRRIHILDMLPRIMCQTIYPEVSERLRQALVLSWEVWDRRCDLNCFELLPPGTPPPLLI